MSYVERSNRTKESGKTNVHASLKGSRLLVPLNKPKDFDVETIWAGEVYVD